MVMPVVTFDVVYRGVLDWRVNVNGVDEPVSFNTCENCITAARARARLHHIESGHTTEVWAPGRTGERECLVRFMHPSDLDELLRRWVHSPDLFGASYVYGPLFPGARR